MLSTDFSQRPWRNVIQQLQQFWQQRLECLDAIIAGTKYNYCNWKRLQILLEFDVSICRKEHVELCSRKCKQLPVLNAGSSDRLNSHGLVTDYERRKIKWKRFVKQDAHLAQALFLPVLAQTLPSL